QRRRAPTCTAAPGPRGPGPTTSLADLPEALRRAGPAARPAPASPAPAPAAVAFGPTLAQTKEEAEAAHILETLRKHSNNRLRAAAELGISRMTLYKKLHRYGLMAANCMAAV